MKFKILFILSIISYSIRGQDLNNFFVEVNVKGSISIYDLKNKEWNHSNAKLAKEGTLPASTFKIIHTLIGLEENIIRGRNDTIRWDKEPKLFKTTKIPNWNKDNDLETAFKNSTIWYFEEIAKQINKCKYRKYLKKNKYTNRNNRKGKDYDFWNFGNLKVSPIEQIELLIKLYKNELSFNKKYQELTKEFMIEKETSSLILRSKTGWCYDTIDIGWYIGFIELEDNVVFFATRIEKELERDLEGFSKLRKSITTNVINKLYDLKLNE